VNNLKCIAPYTWTFGFDDGRFGKIWHVKREITSTYGDHWVGAKSDTEYGIPGQMSSQEITDFHEAFKISAFDPPEFFELPKGEEFYGPKGNFELIKRKQVFSPFKVCVKTWTSVRPDGVQLVVTWVKGKFWFGTVSGDGFTTPSQMTDREISGFREFHGIKYDQRS